jgi:hypothetical protein
VTVPPKYPTDSSSTISRESPRAPRIVLAASASRTGFGPASSTTALLGAATATSARAAETSAAAIGCMSTGDSVIVSPLAPPSARAGMNSKNCVARTIEYGIPLPVTMSSCATLARM